MRGLPKHIWCARIFKHLDIGYLIWDRSPSFLNPIYFLNQYSGVKECVSVAQEQTSYHNLRKEGLRSQIRCHLSKHWNGEIVGYFSASFIWNRPPATKYQTHPLLEILKCGEWHWVFERNVPTLPTSSVKSKDRSLISDKFTTSRPAVGGQYMSDIMVH